MTYKMSKKMFFEFIDAMSTKTRQADKNDVIAYINLTFGLRGTVENIRLI